MEFVSVYNWRIFYLQCSHSQVESPLPLMDNQLTTRIATLESEIFGLKIEVAGIKVVFEADLKELQRQVQYLQDIISPAKLKVDPPNATTRSKKRIDFDSPITPMLQRERKKQEVCMKAMCSL